MNSKFYLSDKETIKKILRNRKKLETKLNVKVKEIINGLEISGEELDIYFAEKVFDAIEKKFPLEVALLLLDETYILESIPIKSTTKKKNLELIRARIIGTKGKTLQIIGELSDCFLTLHDNIVNIIGLAENLKPAINAVKSLISGSKQANVYAYLEKLRARTALTDLGLKIKIKKE